MALVIRICPLCGREIGDRIRTKCPNFKSHVVACRRKRDEKKKKEEIAK
jgi:hypothetical protein